MANDYTASVRKTDDGYIKITQWNPENGNDLSFMVDENGTCYRVSDHDESGVPIFSDPLPLLSALEEIADNASDTLSGALADLVEMTTDREHKKVGASVAEMIEQHWKYVEDMLTAVLPDDIVFSKEKAIKNMGFHYMTAMLHGWKHAMQTAHIRRLETKAYPMCYARMEAQ